MTDISNRIAVLMTLDDEKRRKDPCKAVIQACETYLRLNPEPVAHDFITLSQPNDD